MSLASATKFYSGLLRLFLSDNMFITLVLLMHIIYLPS